MEAMISTNRNVPMTSLIKLAQVFLMAGPVEKQASFEPASGVSAQCGMK